MRKRSRSRRRNAVAVVHHKKRRFSARRRRTNPPVSTRGIVNLAIDGVLHGGAILGAQVGTRYVSRLLGQPPGSVTGVGIQAAMGLGFGLVGPRFIGADLSRSLMHGAFAGALADTIKASGVPVLSELVGDVYQSRTMAAFPVADQRAIGAASANNGRAGSPFQSVTANQDTRHYYG